MSKFPQEVRDKVAHRSQLRCEGCGGEGPLQLHHRQYRSRGGQDTVENALALCGLGNASKCHGRAHTAEGEALGWSVRSRFDPATIPVEHALLGCVYLCEDGTTTAEIRQPVVSSTERKES